MEDRNDPMLQKMRRYIKAFSREDEKDGAEKDGAEKSDATKEEPKLRPKAGGLNTRRALAGWEMIRHSALGLGLEQEEPEEDQDIRYV